MLERLGIRGFKSLRDVDVALKPLSVFFGPNASGKSNIIDAIQFLSASCSSRTLSEALSDAGRGFPIESFAFPAGGLAGLMNEPSPQFEITARVCPTTDQSDASKLRYFLRVGARPKLGEIYNAGEELEKLRGASLTPMGRPRIELVNEAITVRKRHETGRAYTEKLGGNHSILSIPSYTGEQHPEIDAMRSELRGWRAYYLEPRSSMRQAAPPSAADDIGVLGQHLPAYLYSLKHSELYNKDYRQIQRLVRQTISTVESVDVELNEQRAEINLVVEQNGVSFSNRVISEGTLRVIGLAAIALNPRPVRLVAIEEPENGVHPARIENIFALLAHLSERGVQVVVNTHSPLFVSQAMKRQHSHPKDVGVYAVRSDGGSTSVRELQDLLPLFEDATIENALKSDEDAILQALLTRGLLDA